MEQKTSPYTNRLIEETSPYLLQHAHNPVDWCPWGPEAFERARRQDKPIFLSIGYSTCHWCHVMERESFEDEQTARLLNENFVSIKVDREQRPDLDETFLKAVQMMTGSGGWPLSVFLTPDGKPFYGGTYFPPRAGLGRPSFQQVLRSIVQVWQDRRSDLLESAEALTEALSKTVEREPEQTLTPEVLTEAFRALSQSFDHVHGGFGGAPKFPQPAALMFLLSFRHRSGEQAGLEMVEKTLDEMARGGIHDHLGGGFHRYAVDAQWLIPHFEKMLYDQALLGRTYVQAYQITNQTRYADAARDIFDYVLRDMTDIHGGFHAAEDADSEGREGAFYVWRQEQVERILGEPQARVFCRYYGVTREGNFEAGENVLHVTASVDELAAAFDRSPHEIEAMLADARQRLLAERNRRPRPGRDDKVIVAWNGLMISALAYGGAVLDRREYIDAARRAAEFLLDTLQVNGRLMRYFRAGQAVEKAFLEDYAFLARGLLDLYEAGFEVKWLRAARGLAEQMIELFADQAEGGFFRAGRDADRLLAPDKPGYDGAVPSGNSVAAWVLLKLGRLLMEDHLTREGEKVLHRFSGPMVETPTGLPAMLLALDYHWGPTQEIVIAAATAGAGPLIRECRRHFLPRATLLCHATDAADSLGDVVPFVAQLTPVGERATAYVCENYACRRPVTTPEELGEILDATAK
jgi:uncharacterized protein YyaL (SSP411 family)